jgi:hypothetical protein
MLELFPAGFEEVDRPEGVELAAYTDAAGEERMWAFFGGARAADVEGGWEDKWRAFHRPIRVGRLWVGPPWEELPGDGALTVVIDPGRAFGTGSHPTTQLCLAALQELEPQALLDVGSGSVEATLANAAVNGVELDARRVEADERLPPTGVAVANISLESVERLAGRIVCATLVSSGYLASDRPTLPGIEHVARRTLDGWACDVWRAT